jgi:hypothetical protein
MQSTLGLAVIAWVAWWLWSNRHVETCEKHNPVKRLRWVRLGWRRYALAEATVCERCEARLT